MTLGMDSDPEVDDEQSLTAPATHCKTPVMTWQPSISLTQIKATKPLQKCCKETPDPGWPSG